MKFNQRFLAVLAVVLLTAISGFAQTTGNLTGKVILEGNPLPGATVTISSPALQGTRVAYTDVNGLYNIGALPPGEYSVKFDMESMSSVSKTARIGLGQTSRADAEMRLSALAESITVTAAAAPAVLESTEVQANVQQKLQEELPMGRRLQDAALLTPGVTNTGPNAGTSIVISGAPAYDNVFMVNGAVINENLRGQAHNLFIEDAIQETTVLTGGVSAEYGRFTGGVVNAITKSGGNEFSGSLRDSLTNPDWTSKTPFPGEADALDVVNEVYEGTLGGRIIRDRLWFFGAGRYFETATTVPFFRSNETYLATQEEPRYEVKLTGQITPKHSLVGSYLDLETEQGNNCFIRCFEPSNLDTNRTLPNNFTTFQYNGILTNSFLVEATYAEKYFAFVGSGGDRRDFAGGSYGYDANTGSFFGAPVFCGVCSDEERNNSTYGLKGTYYLATKALGTHNIVAGYENWTEERVANNFQSGSNYNIVVYNTPGRDASGVLRPYITAGDLIGFTPIPVLTKGSDFVTDSIFLNDKWDLNSNFSFNIGARYDANDGADSNGSTVASDSNISPRLGLTYDVMGNGRLRFNGTFSRYVSKIAETVGGSTSPAGNPSYTYYEYQGPDINSPNGTGPLNTEQAFGAVERWFLANGGISNQNLIVFASFPGVNTVFTESLKSPAVDEFTIGVGAQIGAAGFARLDYISRDWNDFYATSSTTDRTVVADPAGSTFDLFTINNSDELDRKYDAVSVQAGTRFFNRFEIGGNYTWSELIGNTIGESAGGGPGADTAFRYPEYKAFRENNPTGFLPSDQTHKGRLWLVTDVPTPVGNFNISLLQRYDTGTPFSAIGTVDTRFSATTNPGGVVNPARCQIPAGQTRCSGGGYRLPPTNVTYYFSDRGAFRWDDVTATDLALNYSIPIFKVELFAQAELLNAFDEDAQVSGDTTVNTHRNAGGCPSQPGSACQRFNPLSGQTPILGTHYTLGPSFGQATGAGNYQTPRTYRFSFGLKF